LSSSSPLSSEELAGIIAWKMGVCKGGKARGSVQNKDFVIE